MGDIEREIIFDLSGTRACMKLPDGEFVCSRMTIHGDKRKPDSITLKGVGKTRSAIEAQQWLALGIMPQEGF